MKLEHAKKILSEVCNYHGHSLTLDECKEAMSALVEVDSDARLEIDGAEYRIIPESDIWDIYVEEIEDLVKDCYLGGDKELPWWIEVDWEKTARNTHQDGYGHHFSGYDGSEINTFGTDRDSEKYDFWVFRTN